MRLLLLQLAGMFLLSETFGISPGYPLLATRVYVLQLKNRLDTRQQPLDMRPNTGAILLLLRPVRPPPSHPPQVGNTPKSQITYSEESDLDQTYVPSQISQNLPRPSLIDNNRRHSPTEHVNIPSGSRVGYDSKTTTSKPSMLFPDQSKPSFSQHKPSQLDQDFKTSGSDPNSRPQNFPSVKPQSFGGGRTPSSFDQGQKHPGFDLAEEPLAKKNKTSPVDALGLHPDRNPSCYMRPDPGTCRAAFPRYFLDPKTGTCNCFLYGGCRDDGLDESPGSFFTLEECQQECHPPSMEEGPMCKEIFDDDQFISFLK